MDNERYSLAQLKETLRQLGLSQKGNKSDLLKRLFEHDPTGSWKRTVREIASEKTQQADEESAVHFADEGRTRDEETANAGQEVRDNAETFQEMEIEMLRRERDLMRRELELVRREANFEVNSRSTSFPTTTASQNIAMRTQVKALSELLSEFTGKEDAFWNWKRQLQSIRTTYQLDDGTTRILVGLRLKQRALQWFQSRPEHLEITVDELLERMQSIFDYRPAKIDLRKQFEKRLWRYDENFSNYFYDKIILANKIPVEEEELTDYIIDGIPDEMMRNQARIQRFERKEDLLKAYEKVSLRPVYKDHPMRGSNYSTAKKTDFGRRRKLPEQTVAHEMESRCFNCNQTGHLARNCGKPKKEWGACYECGATSHRLRDCPQRKQRNPEGATATRVDGADRSTTQISNVTKQDDENEFIRRI